MANEITYTGKGDVKIAAVLAQLLHEQAVDNTDLRPTVMYQGSVTNSGSQVIKVAKALFDDAMAAANTDEVTAPGNTDLDTANATITVARQVLVRELSDLYSLTGGVGPDFERFARDMFDAAIKRFTDMLCALYPSLSNSVGTSGAALTVDDVFDGLDTLRQNNVEGPYHMVLHTVQLGQFQGSLRGEGQAIHPPESAMQLRASNSGFQGTWNGVNIWAVDSVTESAGDKIGALYGDKCFGYADGAPSAEIVALAGADAAVTQDGAIFVEIERDATGGLSKVVGNYYVGVSEIEDARGVKIVSVA